MNIDRPGPAFLPELRQLWKRAFGDSDAFLDSFFAVAHSPERCRCVTVGGRPAAALYWFDASCGGQKFAYLYAVATDPEHRGKGLCRALMADTAEVLKERGYHGALLVPQDEQLRAMYRRMGYLDGTSIDEFFCAAGDAPARLREITAEAYAALRPAFLPKSSVDLSGERLAFLKTLVRFYAGDDFLAAVSREEEHLRILEYLGDQAAVPALVAALDQTEATVRAPGTGSPFAMCLPLTKDCKMPDYFAFCLD